MLLRILPTLLCFFGLLSGTVFADELTPEQRKKLDLVIKQAAEWTKDPELVGAVKDYNAKGRETTKNMSQDKWTQLTIMDPVVKELRTNTTAKLLAAKKTEVISESFVSGADGTKVAFISKTSNWSHKGKPKHDEPMAGRTWIGQPEKDASTGLSQVQFSVPIVDSGKAIGSMVIGVAVNKL